MSKKAMTTEEWVRKLNTLGAKIDRWFSAVHPSLWDQMSVELRTDIEAYERLAKYQPCDEDDTPQQLALGYENKGF